MDVCQRIQCVSINSKKRCASACHALTTPTVRSPPCCRMIRRTTTAAAMDPKAAQYATNRPHLVRHCKQQTHGKKLTKNLVMPRRADGRDQPIGQLAEVCSLLQAEYTVPPSHRLPSHHEISTRICQCMLNQMTKKVNSCLCLSATELCLSHSNSTTHAHRFTFIIVSNVSICIISA